MPSKKETLTVIVIMALFLLLTAACIGLRSEHLLMAALYLVLFFAGLPTRKLAVALLPFAIFGISYDWMRICPNYEVNPIDVAGLYNLEKSLFGVMDNGVLVTPCEYFAVHHWAVADVFAGIFYLCWVPVPILFGLCLYFKKERKTYLRFALVFLFVNLIGFVVALVYAIIGKCRWYVIALFSVIMAGIWGTAIYSCHHYIIDVLLGISCALLGWLFFEYGLMKIRGFRNFFDRYYQYIK